MGVFSPWLYYINPAIFPIVNSANNEFHSWLEIQNKSYGEYILIYEKIKTELKCDDLGIIDAFVRDFVADSSIVAAQKLVIKLKEKFTRIWRCADSDSWNELKDKDLLTFSWLNSNIDYKKIEIKGAGKNSIEPWVNELKNGDLIFIMGKNNYNGICFACSEYNFSGPVIRFSSNDQKPAIMSDQII